VCQDLVHRPLVVRVLAILRRKHAVVRATRRSAAFGLALGSSVQVIAATSDAPFCTGEFYLLRARMSTEAATAASVCTASSANAG
jgi:hypothetical protein